MAPFIWVFNRSRSKLSKKRSGSIIKSMDGQGSIIIGYHYHYCTFNYIKLLLKLKLFLLDP